MSKKEPAAKLIEFAYASSTTATKAGYGKVGTWFVALYPEVNSTKRAKIVRFFLGTSEGKKQAKTYADALPQQYNWMHKYFTE